MLYGATYSSGTELEHESVHLVPGDFLIPKKIRLLPIAGTNYADPLYRYYLFAL